MGFLLPRAGSIVLLKRAITFQFTSDCQAEGALALVQRPGGSSVGSRSFFNYYFLKNEGFTGRYLPRKVKIPRVGELWAIKL